MLSKIRSLFQSSTPEVLPEPSASIAPGQRVYAIGDIHGRLDLFDLLLAEIEMDSAARGAAQTTLVLLGDLIDRGPESRGVVDRAMALVAAGNTRVLAGNHEEMLLSSLEDPETLRHFLRHGGKETLFSYGLPQSDYSRSNLEDLHARLPDLVPQAHIDFMRAMEDRIVVDDYLFVHAGIRPGVPVAEQTTSDLRWIRREFLDHTDAHDHLVVHGHTITDAPVMLPNRIGIDTGAFASGRLTALGIEGNERWIVEAFIPPAPKPAD